MEHQKALELWGGVECTINRVGDLYHEQLNRAGHCSREDDFVRLAQLGIRALRQPVLWERTAPAGPEGADFSYSDRALRVLRELSIRPIVGLSHHGSGPRNTSLVDSGYPERLAQYALAVASRYPWVEDYTPVNEPLTTARMSGLYGVWYPHGRDDRTFLTCLINECRATALSMRAIRRVNPAARLVQTDDLGRVFATPRLQYQAEFENERRWLSWDLLCGRVNSQHPLWWRLLDAGISESELFWFQENTCPPDVLGINHYLTSNRYLDEDLDHYPAETHGGNGQDRYADVAAARVELGHSFGAREILQEAWQRYGIPIAVTEVHNGCTREEQLRWLLEIWEAASELSREGADIRAITVWSLLGAHDWNSLVTRKDNHYEPGAFDIRSPQPRETGIAKLARQLGEGKKPSHPVLEVPGWWKRPERQIYEAEQWRKPHSCDDYTHVRPLLIVGAGTLGRALRQACQWRCIPHRLLTRRDVDIADAQAVHAVVEKLRPWAVINAAGYVRVDDAELGPKRCWRENVAGAENLARACHDSGVQFVTFSSDLVFDGTKGDTYVESDPVSPIGVYGASKADAERRVLAQLPSALVVRTSAFFGPEDDYNFVTVALRTIAEGRTFTAAEDCLVSPTYVPDLVDAVMDLLIDEESGIWHLANDGAISWANFARRAASLAGLPVVRVEGVPCRDLGLTAPRPAFSALRSERAWIMPALSNALKRYIEQSRAKRQLLLDAVDSCNAVGSCD